MPTLGPLPSVSSVSGQAGRPRCQARGSGGQQTLKAGGGASSQAEGLRGGRVRTTGQTTGKGWTRRAGATLPRCQRAVLDKSTIV